MDTKTQMMDAGTALIASDEGYGSVLGQIAAEMKAHGKVWTAPEAEGMELPRSTGEFDLFLDRSTPLRSRYISLRLEDAGHLEGKHHYAAVFKEGNRPTPLRSTLLALAAALLIAIPFAIRDLPGLVYARIAGCIFAALVLYQLIVPSKSAPLVVRSIQKKLRSLKGSSNPAA